MAQRDSPAPLNDGRRRSRRTILWQILLVVVVVAGGLAIRHLVLLGRGFSSRGTATIDQAVVVERMREVAKLVTSETSVRDVVIYQHRRFGSTKRALVVVTGKVTAGIDLDRRTEVNVDHQTRRVEIVLPRAEVFGVEITQLTTYDEQSGLLNPFRPADRDTVFLLARERLMSASRDMGVVEHAERSAEQLLEALVMAEGYATEVSFGDAGTAGERGRLDQPPSP